MRQIKARARGSFPALAAAVLGVCWRWGRMWENLQLCPSGGSEEEISSVPRGAEGEAHRVTPQWGCAAGTSLPRQCQPCCQPPLAVVRCGHGLGYGMFTDPYEEVKDAQIFLGWFPVPGAQSSLVGCPVPLVHPTGRDTGLGTGKAPG